LKLKDTSEILL